MKYGFILLVVMGAAPNARAQSAQDSIKASVMALFDAMRRSDSSALVSAFADSAILQSVGPGKDGKEKIMTEAITQFGSFIKKLPAGAADERIVFETIRIDGHLAMVWAPYKFYYKGQLHHCGADSFQLVWQNGVWKIQYLIDSRRKDCE